MVRSQGRPSGTRRAVARWSGRRGSNALVGGALVGVLAALCTACGSTPASMKLSVSSGPPGTVVTLTGDAGSNCVVGKNWSGFAFERYGELTTGPVTSMATPVVSSSNGTWSASFAIPAYLGGSAARGPGAAVAAGRYEFAARPCQSHKLLTASFQVTAGTPASARRDYVAIAVTPDGQGYWLARANGDVTAFGDARSYGSLAVGKLSAAGRIIGIARTYSAGGYWLASADGTIYTFGDARSYGSLGSHNKSITAPVIGIAATATGKGYYLAGANGAVVGFGDAHLSGAPNSDLAPYDAIGARTAGGYIVTSATTSVAYTYPGGVISGGGPGFSLSAELVGTAVTPSGNGTWQVGMDGGVITGGDAGFYGSVPGSTIVLKAPVTAIAATPDGKGYWLLDANGTVYPFGDAKTFPPAASTPN